MIGLTHLQTLAKSAFKQNYADDIPSDSDKNGWWTSILKKGGRMARLAKWIKLRVSWSKSAEDRGKRAINILEAKDQITKAKSHYVVKSQSDSSVTYNVTVDKCKWTCDCLYHKFRKSQCKHILTVMAFVNESEATAVVDNELLEEVTNGSDDKSAEPPDIIIEPVVDIPTCCVSCGHKKIIRWGYVNTEQGKHQRYKCKECNCTFVYRNGFERMRNPPWAILRALNGSPASTVGHRHSATIPSKCEIYLGARCETV